MQISFRKVRSKETAYKTPVQKVMMRYKQGDALIVVKQKPSSTDRRYRYQVGNGEDRGDVMKRWMGG